MILILDEWPPKNKTSSKKNILLLISYTKYTDHATFCLPLPVNVVVSIFADSAFTFLAPTPNISILLTVRAGS